MATPNEYIVFEPDQVLTNDHLNETFNYLDQQDRWTRNKLIGIGIVCGLDIVQHTGVIEITKGCGITSQGYLIVQDTTQYTYYILYAAADQPNDLPFTYTGNLPFYKPYAANKTIYVLLTDDQYNALDSDQQKNAQTLSSAPANFLNSYVVVLFLEAKETDLKNCDMLDCNNKGEKMTFTVRPLLVLKKDIAPLLHSSPHTKRVDIKLKRYNVPYRNLNSSDDVLNAFLRITDDDVLIAIAAAYNFCYQAYHSIWKEKPNPFFELFQKLQGFRNSISSSTGFRIQYFYDFINDLINAYYEFSCRASQIECVCCPDENLFPLHLVLGSAGQNTNEMVRDSYRQYFMPSCISNCGHESVNEIHLLFQRMEKMVNEFFIPDSNQIAHKLNTVAAFTLNQPAANIKITPSQYEAFPLSERAIPYYYLLASQLTQGATPVQYDMHQFWSYKKTLAGNATLNLGYNANFYSNDDAIVNPLFYDIEYFNFFRIEGHIGIDYRVVLTNILEQRKLFNLPFDVVAISADLLNTDSANLPACNIQDLETDYRLIVSEFVCRVQNNFCLFTKITYPPNDQAVIGVAGNIFVNNDSATTQLFHELPASLIFGLTGYKKGDFINNYCPASVNTFGSAYLNVLLNNGGNFVNPVPPQVLKDPQNLLSWTIFEFIDSVEDLMFILMTNSISTLDVNLQLSKFTIAYDRYLLLLNGLTAELVAGTEAANQTQAGATILPVVVQLDQMITDCHILLSICADGRLKTLKDEYFNRLQQYQQQLSFLNYFEKHPGLEHKAGVPKGGTFVIVYHQDQPTLSTNTPGSGLAPATNFTTLQVQQITAFVNNCNDPNAGNKTEIIKILNPPPPVSNKFKLADGVVIADFYIPYMCCSDCGPIAYVLPGEPAAVAVFDIQPKQFLFDDAHNYPFTATPPVTQANTEQKPFVSDPPLSNPNNLNLLTDANNVLYLHPAMSDLTTTLDATLTYKNITLNVTIIKPDAAFTINVATDPAVLSAVITLIQVAAKNDGATSYQWTVNEQENIFDSTSKPGAVNLNAKFPNAENNFTIALTITYVINGQTSTDTKTTILTPQLIKLHFNSGPFEPVYQESAAQPAKVQPVKEQPANAQPTSVKAGVKKVKKKNKKSKP